MDSEMDIDSPNFKRSPGNMSQLMESPLFSATMKSKKLNFIDKSPSLPISKSLSSSLHVHKRTNSLKRPLHLSPKIDSPDCSILAADMSTNFHLNTNYNKFSTNNNPKKLLLSNFDADDAFTSNKENTYSFGLFKSLTHSGNVPTLNRKPSTNLKPDRRRSSSNRSMTTFHSRSSSTASNTSIFKCNSKPNTNTNTNTYTNTGTATNASTNASINGNTDINNNTYTYINTNTTSNANANACSFSNTTLNTNTFNSTSSNPHRLFKSSTINNGDFSIPFLSKFDNSTQINTATSNKKYLLSSTPNGSDNEFEDCNSHRSINSSDLEEIEHEDNTSDSDDNTDKLCDMGSPLQKRSSSRSRIEILSKLKNKNLQRHQSLMQFGHVTNTSSTNNKLLKNRSKFGTLNSDINTEQLTSNINELTFNSNDNNSVLNDIPIELIKYSQNDIPRINVEEFNKIIENYKENKVHKNKKFCKHFDELIIVDCRFEYEFLGGHIDNAINIQTLSQVQSHFFDNEMVRLSPVEFTKNSRKLLIFHCEFSSMRGPLRANDLRRTDRSLNIENYPHLYYPDIVILEGGYKEFYEKSFSSNLKNSLSYVEMHDPQYKDECEKGLDMLRRDKSLSRRNSVNLSRKNSLTTLKNQKSSNSLLDFNGTNKIDFSTIQNQNQNQNQNHKLSSKRSLTDYKLFDLPYSSENGEEESDYYDCEESNSTFVPYPKSAVREEKGIFGGFGKHKIELDTLYDIENNSNSNNSDNNNNIYMNETNNSSFSVFSSTSSLDSTYLKPPASLNSNNKSSSSIYSIPSVPESETFKIPYPRAYKAPRRSNCHSRSQTVGSFNYSNHFGFKSAPLLTTPEKEDAKIMNVFNLRNDNGGEYQSIFAKKIEKHNDTPIPKKNYK